MVELSDTARATIEEAARVAAPVFATQDWRWGIVDPYVPSAADLVEEFTRLYSGLREENEGYLSMSCGRLMAKTDSEGYVQLLLCLGDIFADEH